MATLDETLSTLVACLCDQLASNPNPPAECCLISASPVIPKCCVGFAWVRPVTVFPTDNFPSQGYDTSNNCLPPSWGVTVELGVSRCAPGNCDPTGNPCCSAEATSLTQALADRRAMTVALQCCLVAAVPLLKSRDIEMGAWTLNDPTGGCRQGTMQATIRFDETCDCS